MLEIDLSTITEVILYMWQQIVDLPVIVQGALGSGLFWVIYEVCKRLINLIINLVGKVSSDTQRELRMGDVLFHVRCMDSDSNSGQIVGMFLALRRFITAMIYMCLGLIASKWIGELSVVAYMISVFNLFVALKMLKTSWSSDLTSEEHEEKAKEVFAIMKKGNP